MGAHSRLAFDPVLLLCFVAVFGLKLCLVVLLGCFGMGGDDLFSLLSSGTHFNKQRFGRDFKAFQPAGGAVTESASQPSAAAPLRGGASDAPNGAAASNSSSSKKKKKQRKAKRLRGAVVSDELQPEISGVSLRDKNTANVSTECEGVSSSSDDGDEAGSGSKDEDERLTRSHAGPASTSAAAKDAFSNATCPVIHTRDPVEQANVLRKAFRIKATGTDVPDPLRSFAQLSVLPNGKRRRGAARLLSRMAEEGLVEPTPIQRQAIPALLAGREVLAIAPTGSGKTLAFFAPILLALQAQHSTGDWPDAPKAVVMSPTAELAAQQARVLKLLLPGSKLRARLLSKATAAGSDFSKVDVLLANPLRLATLAAQGKLDLSQVRWLILDEADKLFELGFMEQVDAVLVAATHPRLVRALFSATLPEKVEELARSVLQQPLRITVGVRNSAVDSVRQRLVFAGREAGKLLALRQLITEGLTPPVLVFVASKDRAKELHRELMYDGVHVDSITADQSAAARAAAVDNFRLGRTWLLIATDLLGRGMDFVGINTVINYDFPLTSPDYIHRVGRTGRAGRQGEAITFFTEDDVARLRTIANIIKTSGGDVPEWMLTLKKGRTGRNGLSGGGTGSVSSERGRGSRCGGGSGGRHGGGRGGVAGGHGQRTSTGVISTQPRIDRDKRKRKTQIIEASKQKKAKAVAAEGA